MAIDSRYKLKTGEEVDYFPPIQNTDSPYLTEAAMHADQANQLQGYGYLVDGVGAFTYLGTVAGSSADYEGFGDTNFKTDLEASNTKSTPIDADIFGYLNSAAANVLVKFTWANIKATLKTYFDTLYAPVGSGGGTVSPLQAFSAHLDLTNGNDSTAVLTDPSKTFKTMASLINALPLDYSSFWTIYIIGGGNVEMPKMPNRNFIWIATAPAVLDFTNTAIDPVNFHCLINVSGGTWDFRYGNISIKSDSIEKKQLAVSNDSGTIRYIGHLDKIEWKSPGNSSTRGSVAMINADIIINQITDYSTSTSTLSSRGVSSIRIKKWVVAGKSLLGLGSTDSTNSIIIDDLSGSNSDSVNCNSLIVKKITCTGNVAFLVTYLFFENCTYPDNISLSFAGEVSGNLIGNTYIEYSSNYPVIFNNFSAKFNAIGLTAKHTFNNCYIEVQTHLAELKWSVVTTPIDFNGFNTIISISGDELIKRGVNGPVITDQNYIIKIRGTVATNALLTNYNVEKITNNTY